MTDELHYRSCVGCSAVVPVDKRDWEARRWLCDACWTRTSKGALRARFTHRHRLTRDEDGDLRYQVQVLCNGFKVADATVAWDDVALRLNLEQLKQRTLLPRLRMARKWMRNELEKLGYVR